MSTVQVKMLQKTYDLVVAVSDSLNVDPIQFIDTAVHDQLKRKFGKKPGKRTQKNMELLNTTLALIESKKEELSKLPNPKGCKNTKTGEIYSYYDSASYFARRFGNEKLLNLHDKIAHEFGLPKYGDKR